MLLKEIKLQTNSLVASYNFYKDILGLNTVYSGEKNITITVGKSVLIFEESENNINPFYHFAFNIPSNKFEEAIEWMQQKTELLWLEDYKSYIADFVNWHAKSFYFLDAAGNILEMIARFDLNDVVNETFSSNLIRNISEIGLVFPQKSFDGDVRKLLDQFPLSYFNKQPPMLHFRAVGDDEGYLLLFLKQGFGFLQKIHRHKFSQSKFHLWKMINCMS